MKYSSQIEYQINFINNLIYEYGQNSILQNENFVIDDMSFYDYLIVKFCADKCINFSIYISTDGIQIDIDRVTEVLSISFDDLDKQKEEIKKIFLFVFTCNVNVKYCGDNYTEISFIDENEKIVKKVKFIKGLYIKIGCISKKYNKIYKSDRF